MSSVWQAPRTPALRGDPQIRGYADVLDVLDEIRGVKRGDECRALVRPLRRSAQRLRFGELALTLFLLLTRQVTHPSEPPKASRQLSSADPTVGPSGCFPAQKAFGQRPSARILHRMCPPELAELHRVEYSRYD